MNRKIFIGLMQNIYGAIYMYGTNYVYQKSSTVQITGLHQMAAPLWPAPTVTRTEDDAETSGKS